MQLKFSIVITDYSQFFSLVDNSIDFIQNTDLTNFHFVVLGQINFISLNFQGLATFSRLLIVYFHCLPKNVRIYFWMLFDQFCHGGILSQL
jgi:hypothetical protein